MEDSRKLVLNASEKASSRKFKKYKEKLGTYS
jgi:hypothetical protein